MTHAHALILNLGSTSFKYILFDLATEKEITKETFDIRQKVSVQDEVDRIMRQVLRDIGNPDEIKYIGHRFVHSGDFFDNDQFVDTKDLVKLEKLNHLAPLQNPFNLAGLKACFKYLPEAKNFLAFDTSFYSDLPTSRQVYPIPFKYYEKHGLKKYGFHGISHEYTFQEICRKQKINPNKTNAITIHLGGGCSMTAIQRGEAVDTTMGMTPLEGLMMQTRSGDIDSGLFRLIAEIEECDVREVENILNQKSGLSGIAEVGNYLELLTQKKQGNERAILAFDMFTDRLIKQIGAYIFILGRVDFIAFTGRVGAGDPTTRNTVTRQVKKILPQTKIVKINPNEELAILRKIIQENS